MKSCLFSDSHSVLHRDTLLESSLFEMAIIAAVWQCNSAEIQPDQRWMHIGGSVWETSHTAAAKLDSEARISLRIIRYGLQSAHLPKIFWGFQALNAVPNATGIDWIRRKSSELSSLSSSSSQTIARAQQWQGRTSFVVNKLKVDDGNSQLLEFSREALYIIEKCFFHINNTRNQLNFWKFSYIKLDLVAELKLDPLARTIFKACPRMYASIVFGSRPMPFEDSSAEDAGGRRAQRLYHC